LQDEQLRTFRSRLGGIQFCGAFKEWMHANASLARRRDMMGTWYSDLKEHKHIFPLAKEAQQSDIGF